MKRLLLSLSMLAASACIAQTNALNFTANDCDGNSHDLFSELGSGNVVIIELVMMACQPCINAGNSLKNNVLPNVSDPARVKLYSIGFMDNITCAQMNSWKNANGFTHTVFAGMGDQTTHYGGMGMPTIAVVGGADHAVYYVEQGHSDSDNPAILAAIEDALNAVSVQSMEASGFSLSPNPARDQAVISLPESIGSTRFQLIDSDGRSVLDETINASGARAATIDLRTLSNGSYVAIVGSGDHIVRMPLVIAGRD